jgi:hypothetical protein
MNPADKYRVMAGDLISLARAETDRFQKAEYERLAADYLRLAEQAERTPAPILSMRRRPNLRSLNSSRNSSSSNLKPKTEDKPE